MVLGIGGPCCFCSVQDGQDWILIGFYPCFMVNQPVTLGRSSLCRSFIIPARLTRVSCTLGIKGNNISIKSSAGKNLCENETTWASP